MPDNITICIHIITKWHLLFPTSFTRNIINNLHRSSSRRTKQFTGILQAYHVPLKQVFAGLGYRYRPEDYVNHETVYSNQFANLLHLLVQA
jgi:hypothetical protein|tara:strand:+ start:675 stop:947 length:273 start_codon:yes stop_codon:yes gene_type:complete